jgi:hypothetical protein
MGSGSWMLGGPLVMVGFVVLIVWAVGAMSRGGTSREPERPTALVGLPSVPDLGRLRDG